MEPRPKNDIDSLYDRKKEYNELVSYIEQKFPLVLITGFRRVGKTSLLKTVLETNSEHYVLLDFSDIDKSPDIKRSDVIMLFQKGIQSFLNSHSSREKIMSGLKYVRGVKLLSEVEIQFDSFGPNMLSLSDLFTRLDNWARENNTRIVIAVDEAQEFRKCKQVNMTSIFASIYDNCRNTVLLLTGSKVGFLYDFLGVNDPNSFLFGRSRGEIKLKPFTHDQSIEFLSLGLKQHKLKEIDENVLSFAANELGGIIGWLNDFGLMCIKHGKVQKQFVTEIKHIGAQLTRTEFEKFLNGRHADKKYTSIIKRLSIESHRWSNLKRLLELDFDVKLHDKNFSQLLHVLVKAGFIQEINNNYSVVDPLLAHSFKIE